MRKKMSKTLIGESSWDSECFELCLGTLHSSYLHNDFFISSNKNNTKLINRILVTIKSAFVSLKAIYRNDELYFSSLNFEVLIVAYFMRWYGNAYIFLPNTIGNPSSYNKIFNKVMEAYKGKIYVSDTVTISTLEVFSASLPQKAFDFNLPNRDNLKDIKYVVAFPAALSHKATGKESDKHYLFSQQIVDTLSGYGLEVYILPHPRDREYICDEFYGKETISSDDIKDLGDNVCYVSACSSLSLNRRYGGEYGCWVSIDGIDSLPESLAVKKQDLVDISYFENR
ncbi:hypothetical protein L3V27_14085 [Vibrio sp. J2-3(2022)]|nr:hypothetical protein [Vibrio sp. J2-3(2022)]MCF7372064.1 hypothetical protein [Vibrio sp. J2-3(2022)]